MSEVLEIDMSEMETPPKTEKKRSSRPKPKPANTVTKSNGLTEKQVKEVMDTALIAAKAFIKPGMTLADVDAAWTNAIIASKAISKL